MHDDDQANLMNVVLSSWSCVADVMTHRCLIIPATLRSSTCMLTDGAATHAKACSIIETQALQCTLASWIGQVRSLVTTRVVL